MPLISIKIKMIYGDLTMKKITKILLTVLSAALLIGSLLLVSGADDTSVYDILPTWQYTDSAGSTQTTNALGTATLNAKSGTTIKLLNSGTDNATTLASYAVDGGGGGNAYATVSTGKTLTVDLCGYTYNVLLPDKFVRIAVNGNLTMQNGTLNVAYDSAYSSSDTTSPLFKLHNSASVLTLKNMTTYSGALIYNENAASVGSSTYTCPKIYIDGGKYYVTRDTSDMIGGGFIETRTNTIFEAKNATFYVSKRSLVSAMNYKISDPTGKAVENKFLFDSCDIICSDPGINIVNNANNKTFITFSNSRIYGSIIPTKNSYDTNYTDPLVGNIVLGEGTVLAKASVLSNAVTLADGLCFSKFDKTVATELDIPSGKLLDKTFKVSKTNVSCEYLKAVTDSSDAVFKYFDKTGMELHSTKDMTLVDVVADSLTTVPITMLQDYTLVVDFICTLNYEFNLDINGNTLYVQQDKERTILVQTDRDITFENGNIVVEAVPGEIETDIPEFTPVVGVGGSKEKCLPSPFLIVQHDNASIRIKNVNFYGGALAYSATNTGASIELEGGEYHTVSTSEGSPSALFVSESGMSVSANGAKLYVGGDSALLYSTDADSDFSFTDCTVIAETAEQSLIKTVGASTSVKFKSSFVGGSIAPTAGSPDNGTVVLDVGTTVADGAILSTGTVVAVDGYEITDKSGSKTVSLALSSGSFIDGDFVIAATENAYPIGKGITKIVKTTLTVTWYKEDGKTVIASYEVDPGTEVTPPDYTPSAGVGNGWYTANAYSGWATSIGGKKVLEDTNTEIDTDIPEFTPIVGIGGSQTSSVPKSMVITEDTSFYPAKLGTVSPRLTVAAYNLTFYGSVGINFFIPYNTPEEITVVGVYLANGNELTGVKTNVDGTYYNRYFVGKVGVANLTDEHLISVKFSVNGTVLTQNLTLKPSNYANSVLLDSKNVASGTNVYPETAHTLIADLVRYSNTLSIAANGTSNETLDTILDEYGSLCSDLPIVTEFTKHTTSALALGDYIDYITFAISKDQPRYMVSFTSGSKVTDVTFTVNGYLEENSAPGVNFGAVTYNKAASSVVSGGYLTVAYSEDIPIYNLDRDVTITLTLDGGTTVSGTYNLNEYYTGMSATGETRDNYREFLRALRAFAITGASYRYPDGELFGGAKYDFWLCEHENTAKFSFDTGRFCYDCATEIFFYGDYGAMGDGRANDFGAAYMAHTAANAYSLANPDARVAVSASRGSAGSTFLFGTPMKNSVTSHNGSIEIKTDTDWSGATFIFDDRLVPQAGSLDSYAVFVVATDDAAVNCKSNLISVAAGASNIGYVPGKQMLVYLVDSNIKHYFRYGLNASNGQNRQEVILVDEFGNVDPGTPVEWDYTTITTATAYPAYDKPITISGLDDNGEISCKIINKANHDVITTSYVSYNRGIAVKRSNVNIGGIYHELHEIHDWYYSTSNSAHVDYNKDLIDLGYDVRPMSEIYQNGQYIRRTAYSGIVHTQYANGVVIFDMSVENHTGRYITNDDALYTLPSSDRNSLGSYEFGGSLSSNIAWIRCESRNVFNEDPNFGTIGAVTYHGMFGTNYMRNMYFKNCFLNSMDAHSGAYNVTIEDSEFEHMNFVGGGDIVIKNTIVYIDGGAGAIRLRSDYGSQWHGDIYVDGLEIRHHVSYSGVNNRKALIDGWTYDHSWGPHDRTWTETVDGAAVTRNHTTTYMPTNVTVKNVTLVSYEHEVIDKATGAVKHVNYKPSTAALYFYNRMYNCTSVMNFKYNTYVPTESFNIIVEEGTDAANVKWYWSTKSDIMKDMVVTVTVIDAETGAETVTTVTGGNYIP